MKKQTIITILFAVILGLASCNRDSNYEDKVEQVIVYVSAETGMFYNVPNTTLEEGKSVGQVFDSTLNQEPVTIFIRSPSACKDMKRFR